MEAPIGSKGHAIASQFFQWARLCEESKAFQGEIVFDPSPSFSFPITDFTPELSGRIRIHFLSLLGASSPLPHHFNTPLLSHDNGSDAYYAFMALLNRFFYRALYAAWKSNHAYLFSGHRQMYHDMLEPYAKTPWLARPHLHYAPTMIGLQTLLVRLCGDIPVVAKRVAEYSKTRGTPLSDGFPVKLSDNAILGSRVLTHEGHVHVTVGPLPCGEAKAWLPSESIGKRVLTQAIRYLGVGFTVRWTIFIHEQRTVTYLNGRSQLSHYAFLGRSVRMMSIG